MLKNIAAIFRGQFLSFVDITVSCLKINRSIITMVVTKRPTLLITLLLTLLLFSCSTPKELEYREFKNFTVEKLGFSASSIRMDLVYFNPNNFGLQLKSLELDVFLDNNYVGHTVQEAFVSIPRREEFAIPVKVDVDMKNLLKNSFASFLKSEVIVKVIGTIKVGKSNIFKSFPVNYESKQSFTLF